MALTTYPKCKNDSWSWYIDEEVSEYTIWHCCICGYTAFEDESEETVCPECGQKLDMLLFDDNQKYRYCSQCKRIRIVE